MENITVFRIAISCFMLPIAVVLWMHRDELQPPVPSAQSIQGEVLYFTSPS